MGRNDSTYIERGGVADYFKDIFYTPDGIKNLISKAAALRDLQLQYGDGRVSHYDDDPRTAFVIASLFPNIHVYLVHYGTTGLLYSRKELDELPNLYRVAVLGQPKPR